MTNNFVKINCGSIPASLLEAELFGYEAGSFTGALTKGKQGLFEIANNGTILLDEIGDMPIEAQQKILRVLQNGEIYRVGGISPIKVNVRVIASTNKNLEEMIKQNTFRNDLFYRLNVVTLTIPPLCERIDDIEPLILHFSNIFNKKYGTVKEFSPELISTLKTYSWPGNVRELKNLVEGMIVLCNENILRPEHYYSKFVKANTHGDINPNSFITINGLVPLKEAVRYVERKLVSMALIKAKNTRNAAELLNVSQSTIMRKIHDYHISIGESADIDLDSIRTLK